MDVTTGDADNPIALIFLKPAWKASAGLVHFFVLRAFIAVSSRIKVASLCVSRSAF